MSLWLSVGSLHSHQSKGCLGRGSMFSSIEWVSTENPVMVCERQNTSSLWETWMSILILKHGFLWIEADTAPYTLVSGPIWRPNYTFSINICTLLSIEIDIKVKLVRKKSLHSNLHNNTLKGYYDSKCMFTKHEYTLYHKNKTIIVGDINTLILPLNRLSG